MLQKAYGIINAGSEYRGVAFCYIFIPLKYLYITILF